MLRSIWRWHRGLPTTESYGEGAASGSVVGRPDRSRGLETSAAPNLNPWLCVVPRDAQEGEEITITGHDFDLLMGQPVVFPLAEQLGRPTKAARIW